MPPPRKTPKASTSSKVDSLNSKGEIKYSLGLLRFERTKFNNTMTKANLKVGVIDKCDYRKTISVTDEGRKVGTFQVNTVANVELASAKNGDIFPRYEIHDQVLCENIIKGFKLPLNELCTAPELEEGKLQFSHPRASYLGDIGNEIIESGCSSVRGKFLLRIIGLSVYTYTNGEKRHWLKLQLMDLTDYELLSDKASTEEEVDLEEERANAMSF